MPRCPDTVDGQHSAATWSGRCLYCRAIIARPRHQRRYHRKPSIQEIEFLLRVRSPSGPVDELGRHVY